MTRAKANLLLLVAALIWGTAFLAQKYGNDAIAPLVFVGLRFALSALAVLPLMLWEARRPGVHALTRADLGLGVGLGFCLFAGSSLQQIGLLDTTITNGGFLTSLYVLMVPVLVWLIRSERPRGVVVWACLLSVGGAWLLTSGGQAQGFTRGDLIVVASDLAWSSGIALAPVFLTRTGRPFLLCFIQYTVTGVLGLGGGLPFGPIDGDMLVAAAPAVLYAGLLSGGIAFTLQNVAQRHTPAAEAALIMSLENVFAALTGMIWLDEAMTLLSFAGCLCILAGVLLPDLWGGYRAAERGRRRAREGLDHRLGPG